MKRTLVLVGAWVLTWAAFATAQTPEESVPLDTVETVDITGRGSIGAAGGGMLFLTGGPFESGGISQTRLIGQAMFKYVFTPSISGVAEFGWGWNTYSDMEPDTIAVVVPVTLGVEYRRHMGGKFWPHAAVGGGFYWIGIKDTPDSYASAGDDAKKLKWWSPGLYGKIGTEYLFSSGVSINFDFLLHRVFSSNEEYAYTRGIPDDPLNNDWGLQNTMFGELRLGVNYYFAFKSEEAAPESPPGETP